MSKWTLWNKGQQTLCSACLGKISGKPKDGCIESRHQQSYEKNAAATMKRRGAAQIEALVKYSGHTPPECVLCGFSNILALQLDHIDGDGAAFRKVNPHQTGKSLTLFLRKRNWPTGYRVLCANCQCLERERLGVNGGRKL